jgi:hypothetical protein
LDIYFSHQKNILIIKEENFSSQQYGNAFNPHS